MNWLMSLWVGSGLLAATISLIQDYASYRDPDGTVTEFRWTWIGQGLLVGAVAGPLTGLAMAVDYLIDGD